jgi:hypothetical protein
MRIYYYILAATAAWALAGHSEPGFRHQDRWKVPAGRASIGFVVGIKTRCRSFRGHASADREKR